MSTQIQYTPPPIQVVRDDVCYTTPGSAEIKHGFLVSTYMGDEKLNAILEAEDNSIVGAYTLTACPIVIQNQLNDKKVVVLRDRTNQNVVYGVQTLNDNGTISTNYYNIDGTPFTGNINNLELAGDTLNYSSPTIFCHNGTETVSRTDIWDERRNLVAVIWQNTLGAIVTEPSGGTLTAGSCNLPLDTELITQVDNQLNPDSSLSGRYSYFYRVNVHDSNGNVIYSRIKLSNGDNYTPIGRISTEPLMPPITAGIQRLTNGQEWNSSVLTQSIGWAIEYANTNNRVEITAPGSFVPLYIERINYHGHWSVDDAADSNLYGIKVKANGISKVLIDYTEQPQLIEVDPTIPVIPPTPTPPTPQVPVGSMVCASQCSINGTGKAFVFENIGTFELTVAPAPSIAISRSRPIAIEVYLWSEEPNTALRGRGSAIAALSADGGTFTATIDTTHKWISVFARNPGNNYLDATCFLVASNTLSLLAYS